MTVDLSYYLLLVLILADGESRITVNEWGLPDVIDGYTVDPWWLVKEQNFCKTGALVLLL